jgi:hypothetical protein
MCGIWYLANENQYFVTPTFSTENEYLFPQLRVALPPHELGGEETKTRIDGMYTYWTCGLSESDTLNGCGLKLK